MKFSWGKIARPTVCLAPMAGFTDSAFRQIVKEIKPNIICFSELTSINALEYDSKKTLKMLEFSPKEQPLIVQLFGNDPEYFIDAGKKLEKRGIAGIDVNFGCPAPKVTKNSFGSALLNHPETAEKIISVLSKAVKIPISVKMRIGYSSYNKDKFIDFIRRIEHAGASALTIHGRTTKQGYSYKANFEPIYLAKSFLKIPVIGNGDIDSPEKALKMIKSPDGKIVLDGLMIGRASIGNPWIMADIWNALKNTSVKSNVHKPFSFQTSNKDSTITQPPPLTFSQKLPTIKKHLRLALKLHGEKIGLLEMRKHLGSYISGVGNAASFRQEVMQAKSEEEVLKILDSIA